MSNKRYLAIVFPLVFLCTSLGAYSQDTNGYIHFDKKRKVDPQNIIAKFKPNAKILAEDSSFRALHSAVSQRISLVPGLVVFGENSQGVSSLHALKSVDRLKKRIAELNATGLFEYVQPDFVLHKLEVAPTDQAFAQGKLWGLKNDGQNGGVKGADINAVAAWGITTGSKDVIVAVVDTGVRYTHKDLKSQMWVNTDEIPDNQIDDDNDGYVDNIYGMNAVNDGGDPMDTEGHGTHVAGTIGAAANDGNQHVGVAWNVSIMACKFLGEGGEGTVSGALKAMAFAVDNGAKIINASWGGSDNDEPLKEAIAAMADKGVLFVAAAGNDGANNDRSPSFPANFKLPNIISVAALTKSDTLAGFSNFGANSVHIGAPGDQIYSSSSESDDAYRQLSGTSMATPHVVGVAALVKARYPDISVGALRNRILASAFPVAALATKVTSKGRLNAHGALTVAPDGILEVSIMPGTGSEVKAQDTIKVEVSVHDIDPVKSATVEARVGAQVLLLTDSGETPDRIKGDGIYTGLLPIDKNADKVSYEVTVQATGKKKFTSAVEYKIIQPLANDDFVNRSLLESKGNLSIGATNSHATRESAEPMIAGMGGGASVWWTWTAPAGLENAKIEINTEGSSFDTLLAVYTGKELATLKVVAENDDSYIGSTSAVSFNARPGTVYQIAVDGYMGAQGDITLNLKPASSEFDER